MEIDHKGECVMRWSDNSCFMDSHHFCWFIPVKSRAEMKASVHWVLHQSTPGSKTWLEELICCSSAMLATGFNPNNPLMKGLPTNYSKGSLHFLDLSDISTCSLWMSVHNEIRLVIFYKNLEKKSIKLPCHSSVKSTEWIHHEVPIMFEW